MIDTKELRRLAQAALAAPDGLSAEWMDRLGQFQEAADASVVLELLDRLEEAEKERNSARELADRLALALNTSNHERENLRAKIAEMERQEPVATVRINAINGNPSVDFVPGHHYLHHNDKLYLAPGAQPAPSVPDTHNDMVMGLDYQGAMSCARQRANQEAGLLYPEGDARKEEMERELAGEYYRQYTTPNQGAKP